MGWEDFNFDVHDEVHDGYNEWAQMRGHECKPLELHVLSAR